MVGMVARRIPNDAYSYSYTGAVRLGFGSSSFSRREAEREISKIIVFSMNTGGILTTDTSVITIHPEIMGGTPVFKGTRVPVQTFIEYLEGGDSIDDFLDGFPTVSREQTIALLEEAKEKLLAVA
uniref:Uncharacterized conserved protein, DUF433 family n=1 Tax=Candidatus Kentrum sp. FW TaxID=2126338 RepID=A0A450TJA0_9GAMM|nr:MAG: Uncharacterized conserved protein, DUF433 family [Candidatus Kentron sp. FW]